jgi:hypothetical protein
VALEELTGPEGIVALAGAAVALVALVLAIVLTIRVRRLRSAQSAVLGGHERRDLVAHGERLEQGFVELRDWVEETLHRLGDQTASQDVRIDDAIAYRALIRYDAYGEMSGRQSSSFALLDRHGSGLVVSSIHHRDQARVYMKQLHEGASEAQLSPEEQQAVDTALSDAPGGVRKDSGGARARQTA